MSRRNSRVRSLLGAVALVAAVGCDGAKDAGSGVAMGSAHQAAGSGPDLVVSSVTGPASVAMGQQFTASVTVCNQGTDPGSAPVEVYLSPDPIITPNGPNGPSPDPYVGSAYPTSLYPGQCQTLSVQGPAWGPADGAYYLGAVVDPQNGLSEADETNNSMAGSLIGVGNKPDLVVSSVTGPASVQPGQQLTALVTVCNQGTQPGSAPVEVYLSQDTTITPYGPNGPSPDFIVGPAYPPTLNPGQCQMVTVQGSAWVPSDGAYYLGAVVDPQNGLPELIEDNNATAGSLIGVGNKPDLVVKSVTGPASVQPGQSFTTSVTVCNQGTQPGSSLVEVYLSPDSTITPYSPNGPAPDYLVGPVYPPTLNPGECQTVTLQNSAWVPNDGAYYLGAVVDPQNGLQELIEDNNITLGSRIGVGSKPDLVVASVEGPASVQPGQMFTASVTVCNQGTQPGSAPVEVYLSPDAVITPYGPNGPSPDYFVGPVYSPTLNPGQCQTVTMQGSAWVPTEGAYYLGAVVDSQNGLPELIEDNNATAGTRMGVGNGPDLVVASVEGPASAQMGDSITAWVTVCNQGTQSGSAPLELYLSPDTTITPNGPNGPSPDFFFGYASLPMLDPGQCQTLAVQNPAWVPTEGAYYLGAVVDPQNGLPELIEDNNATAGTRMGLGSKPDFTVSSASGPASALPGQTITASVTVCNQGTQPGSAPVEVYLSSDATITPNGPNGPSPDFFLGYASTATLVPGQCQTVSVSGNAYVPSDGAYFIGAVVDPQNSVQELIEDNNTQASNRIGVGSKPDFTVSSVSSVSSVHLGQSLTATVKVCNQGTQAASAPLEVYLSTDTTITPNGPNGPSPDAFLGYAGTATLNPGQCQTLYVTGPASVPTAGAYYLGAVVDPQNGLPELLEDNNSKVGTFVSVTP